MVELKGSDGSRATVERLDGTSGTAVIKIVGEIDLSNVRALRSAVEPMIEGESDRLVFDLSGIQFMDSSGIAFMLTMLDRFSSVELRETPPLVKRIIELTGLTGVLKMAP